MKDIKPLLLVLLSIGLVATWVYHFYDKAEYSRQAAVMTEKDSTAVANEVRDSLQQIYTAVISDLDLRLDSTRNNSDSLQNALNTKVKEINRLKAEIASVLRNPRSTTGEVAVARQKMKELETIVGQLREEKSTLETEKQQLSTRLEEVSGEVNDLQKNIHRLDEENKKLAEKIKAASIFVASALHLNAFTIRDSKEQETTQAKKTDKFVASFVIQNNFNDYMNAEIVIVILKPDGSALQSSTWDSGSFDPKSGARKNFTRKIKFDYTKGEQKLLLFSLDTDSLDKGPYTLQVWHDGLLIGQTSKTLN